MNNAHLKGGRGHSRRLHPMNSIDLWWHSFMSSCSWFYFPSHLEWIYPTNGPCVSKCWEQRLAQDRSRSEWNFRIVGLMEDNASTMLLYIDFYLSAVTSEGEVTSDSTAIMSRNGQLHDKKPALQAAAQDVAHLLRYCLNSAPVHKNIFQLVEYRCNLRLGSTEWIQYIISLFQWGTEEGFQSLQIYYTDIKTHLPSIHRLQTEQHVSQGCYLKVEVLGRESWSKGHLSVAPLQQVRHHMSALDLSLKKLIDTSTYFIIGHCSTVNNVKLLSCCKKRDIFYTANR